MMRWAAAIEATRIGVAIRQSTWIFAAMEVVHLFGLTLLLGTTIVLSLRMFGAGMRDQSVAQLAADTRPWNTLGLFLSVGSGVILAVSEAVKLMASPPFAIKMVLFVLALLYTQTIHSRMVRRQTPPGVAEKLSAAIVLMLWFGVALAGRTIGFY